MPTPTKPRRTHAALVEAAEARLTELKLRPIRTAARSVYKRVVAIGVAAQVAEAESLANACCDFLKALDAFALENGEEFYEGMSPSEEIAAIERRERAS